MIDEYLGAGGGAYLDNKNLTALYFQPPSAYRHEISGSVFNGKVPSKANVVVFNKKTLTVAANLMVGPDGLYRTCLIPNGSYFVVAFNMDGKINAVISDSIIPSEVQ